MNNLKFSYKDTGLVASALMSEILTKADPYTNHLVSVVESGTYTAQESSINLPSDKENIAAMKDFGIRYHTDELKYIFVIGIGGSNLGTMAVYDAMYGKLDLLFQERKPKIIFVETVSTSFYRQLEHVLLSISNPEEIVINIISKSGGTTETIALFEILYNIFRSNYDKINERVVVTTDEGSKLWNVAKEKGFPCLSIPSTVGGRFSVLSSVGLFPLAMAGIDIDALTAGARDMRDQSLSGNQEENNPLLSAAVIYAHRQQGIRINNNFFFNVQLESMGKWYRQLMGESIGKEKDKDGNTVHEGVTPIVSIGSTDLHSLAQLYIGGPNDKLHQFIAVPEYDVALSVPENQCFPGLVASIAHKDLGNIMDAIRNGVKIAYTKAHIPFTEIILESCDAYNLGSYLQFKMIEMMYLGMLLHVNTFDQPNVEDYKQETRNLLKT